MSPLNRLTMGWRPPCLQSCTHPAVSFVISSLWRVWLTRALAEKNWRQLSISHVTLCWRVSLLLALKTLQTSTVSTLHSPSVYNGKVDSIFANNLYFEQVNVVSLIWRKSSFMFTTDQGDSSEGDRRANSIFFYKKSVSVKAVPSLVRHMCLGLLPINLWGRSLDTPAGQTCCQLRTLVDPNCNSFFRGKYNSVNEVSLFAVVCLAKRRRDLPLAVTST